MPTYSYECKKCGEIKDVFHSISTNPRIKCDACGGACKRKLGTGSGIIFKGSGFYETDYRRAGSKTGSEVKTEAASESKGGDSKSVETKAESKGTDAKSESKGNGAKAEKSGSDSKTETKPKAEPKQDSGPKVASKGAKKTGRGR